MAQAKHLRALDYLHDLYPDPADLADRVRSDDAPTKAETVRRWLRDRRVPQRRHREALIQAYEEEKKLERA